MFRCILFSGMEDSNIIRSVVPTILVFLTSFVGIYYFWWKLDVRLKPWYYACAVGSLMLLAYGIYRSLDAIYSVLGAL